MNQTVIALGFFDGVHRGHGALLEKTVQRAQELGAEPMVFTFDRPPKEVVTGKPVFLLNSPEDRQELMKRIYGIDRVLLAPFDREMMTLPWDAFVEQKLVRDLNAVHLVAGHDYHFGYKNQGDPQLLQEKCRELGVGKIATLMGRYYAMDRDKRWDRVEAAYDAMVYGESAHVNPLPVAAVKDAYAAGVTDEFIEPVICDGDGTISDNDSVIFFNYRPDRAREITRTLVDPKFDGFTRQYFPVTFVCTTEYDATMPNVEVAYPRQAVRNGLGEYLSNLGLTQLRIAETEKYAHVTFFFNGGVETQFPGEDRVLVPSPKVATYDLQPEMSAYEVCDKCVERIESGAYDVIILNFANCDMVGHTGVFDAAVKAVETVDECVGKVVDATMKMGGIAMITADHGNAETMTQEDGSPMTAHTTDLVPFILCGAGSELRQGRLADIAPTILDVMGLAAPEEMDGQTLIVK